MMAKANSYLEINDFAERFSNLATSSKFTILLMQIIKRKLIVLIYLGSL